MLDVIVYNNGELVKVVVVKDYLTTTKDTASSKVFFVKLYIVDLEGE